MYRLILFLILGAITSTQIQANSTKLNDKKVTIKGSIIDSENEEPIPYAHIFIEGTLMGTTSDDDGNFTLQIDETSSKPLIISAVGYKNQILTSYSPDKELSVILESNVYMLEDVVIKGDNLPTQRKLRMFEAYFLGISDNAANTEILNPDDLYLYYDKKTKTLHASSEVPIIINNYALGYKLIYYLEEFKASRRDIQYTGNYHFEELSNIPNGPIEKIKEQRERTYKGSRLQLIRSIYNNTLRKDGFSLLYNNYKKVELAEICSALTTGEKVVCFNQDVIIYFGNNNYSETSYLTQIEACTKIAKDGYFDPKSLKWSGVISEKRVADLLPYEYTPSKK